jgi:hypothetical protein
MTREYITDLAKTFKHPPNWIRTDKGTDADQKNLCDSYLARPLYPIIATPDRITFDGNRRLDAILRFAPLKGDTPVQACITSEPFSPEISLEIQVESARHTRALSDYEIFLAASQWLELVQGSTARDFASRTKCDEGVLSKILCLSKGIPAVKDAARDGLLGYTKWHPICKRPPEEQATLLAACLNGATRDQLQEHARKPGTANGTPPARLPKLTIPLASKAATGTVTIATTNGESFDHLLTVLREAIKAVEYAKAEKCTVKTAQALWADRAKAGA